MRKTKYLGFIVGEGGIEVDAKLEGLAGKELQAPKQGSTLILFMYSIILH